jgi:methyl-accepting chemotaxis protein
MLASVRQKLLRLADPLSLLAVFTAVVLLILYLIIQNSLLLAVCLAYTAGGLYGIAVYQPGKPAPAPVVTADGEPVSDEHLPIATLEMPMVHMPGSKDTLLDITTRMGVTVDGLVRAIHAINAVTQQQSGGAEEQAQVIKNTNSRLDDFLALSERIGTQARHVIQTAEQAAETSLSGSSAIHQSIDSMDDIRTQVEAIGETIVKLAKLTRRIDEIITSVSEIATQSNLLALNASIEAARAGAHGRGFAVVADEVRSLAQQSTASAGQVRAILIEIQQAMKETVRATESGVQNVDTGVKRTREAGTVMEQLASSVQASRDAMREIYHVIQEQSGGMEEIAISVERIERLTHQSLASTRTVEAVSANLTRLAADLQAAFGQGEPEGVPAVMR